MYVAFYACVAKKNNDDDGGDNNTNETGTLRNEQNTQRHTHAYIYDCVTFCLCILLFA